MIIMKACYPTCAWRQYIAAVSPSEREEKPFLEFLIREMTHYLASADVVLWDTALYDAAIRGGEAFVGTPIEPGDVPPKMQYWVLDKDYHLNAQGRAYLQCPENFVVGGFLLLPYHQFAAIVQKYVSSPLKQMEKMVQYGFADKDTPGVLWIPILVRCMEGVTEVKKLAPQDILPRFIFRAAFVAGDSIHAGEEPYFAAKRFMDLDFVETPAHEFNHRERKQFKRSNATLPAIRTVLLRKRKRQTQEGERELNEKH